VKKDILRLLPIRILPSRYIGRRSEVEAAGVSEQVYWIPPEIMRVPARVTIFNTIRLNEDLNNQFPQNVVERIILHEQGHIAQSRIDRAWLLFKSILTGVAALLSVLYVVGISLYAATNPVPIPQVIGFLILSLFLLSVFLWLNWRVRFKDELHAEQHVLNHLGEDEFRRRSEVFEEIVDRSWYGQLKRRLFYPSVKTVISEHEDE